MVESVRVASPIGFHVTQEIPAFQLRNFNLMEIQSFPVKLPIGFEKRFFC